MPWLGWMEEWNDHLVGNVERYGDMPWTITIRLLRTIDLDRQGHSSIYITLK